MNNSSKTNLYSQIYCRRGNGTFMTLLIPVKVYGMLHCSDICLRAFRKDLSSSCNRTDFKYFKSLKSRRGNAAKTPRPLPAQVVTQIRFHFVVQDSPMVRVKFHM
jgi:hypothetical protein